MMNIYCCNCTKNIKTELITGKEAYPHRGDLAYLKFWQCPHCKNFVGVHKNNVNNEPLGNIPTKELKKARIRIHETLDPLWQAGLVSRGKLYAHISKQLGYTYHTGETRTVAECEQVLEIIENFLDNDLRD